MPYWSRDRSVRHGYRVCSVKICAIALCGPQIAPGLPSSSDFMGAVGSLVRRERFAVGHAIAVGDSARRRYPGMTAIGLGAIVMSVAGRRSILPPPISSRESYTPDPQARGRATCSASGRVLSIVRWAASVRRSVAAAQAIPARPAYCPLRGVIEIMDCPQAGYCVVPLNELGAADVDGAFPAD